MARIVAARGRGRAPKAVDGETGGKGSRKAAKPGFKLPGLSLRDLLAVIDELDLLEMTLETVPTLGLLARMMANVQRCDDPEERDEIALLGFRRRGIDVDYDKGVTALRPWDSGDAIDVGAAPEMIVEAVRWRLQRVSAALSAAGNTR